MCLRSAMVSRHARERIVHRSPHVVPAGTDADESVPARRLVLVIVLLVLLLAPTVRSSAIDRVGSVSLGVLALALLLLLLPSHRSSALRRFIVLVRISRWLPHSKARSSRRSLLRVPLNFFEETQGIVTRWSTPDVRQEVGRVSRLVLSLLSLVLKLSPNLRVLRRVVEPLLRRLLLSRRRFTRAVIVVVASKRLSLRTSKVVRTSSMRSTTGSRCRRAPRRVSVVIVIIASLLVWRSLILLWLLRPSRLVVSLTFAVLVLVIERLSRNGPARRRWLID